MAQRLIVEGKDAIALAVLCQKSGLKQPLGYDQSIKFKEEFISVGGSDKGVLKQLQLSLREPNLTNIGVIIDANDKGALARWQSIRAILAQHYQPVTLRSADALTGPKIIIETGMPTVGIWLMPDNTNIGYLEHFLAGLIPTSDLLWAHVNSTVDDLLLNKPFNELTSTKKQKALLYTWLAWKESPGKPFGQAIQSGYFNHTAPVVQPFLDWFAQVFKLTP